MRDERIYPSEHVGVPGVEQEEGVGKDAEAALPHAVQCRELLGHEEGLRQEGGLGGQVPQAGLPGRGDQLQGFQPPLDGVQTAYVIALAVPWAHAAGGVLIRQLPRKREEEVDQPLARGNVCGCCQRLQPDGQGFLWLHLLQLPAHQTPRDIFHVFSSVVKRGPRARGTRPRHGGDEVNTGR